MTLASFSKKAVALWMASVLLGAEFEIATGCSAGSGGGGSVPEDFNELVVASNDQAASLNTETQDLVSAVETVAGAAGDASTTNDEIDDAIDAYIAAGEAFSESYEFYGNLIDAYVEDLDGSSTALILGDGIKFQSADPRTLRAIDAQIAAARRAKQECDDLYPDDEVQQAICKRERTIALLQETGRIGFGVTLAAGGSKIVGAACAAASAPGLVTFAAVVGTGVAVYALWNYCTAPSSSPLTVSGKAQDAECGCAAVNACEGTTRKLSDGRIIASCTFSQGTGTLVVHPPNGTPVVEELTIDEDGFIIDLSGCTGGEGAASASDAEDCNGGAAEEPIDLTGSTCSDIVAVNSSNSPSDPSAGESVVVSYCVTPPISGCPTSYSVSGTDSYAASGTPATDGSGCASFTIPGGATGVVDTVTIQETTNDLDSRIVYTF